MYAMMTNRQLHRTPVPPSLHERGISYRFPNSVHAVVRTTPLCNSIRLRFASRLSNKIDCHASDECDDRKRHRDPDEDLCANTEFC
jgi:hypothetical protein